MITGASEGIGAACAREFQKRGARLSLAIDALLRVYDHVLLDAGTASDLLAELLTLDPPLRQAILARSDTTTLEALANRPGRQTLREAAAQAVGDGLTTAEEIERVLGPN